MRNAALAVLLLSITALCAPAARAQIMLPDKSPTKGQQGSLDTSCGAWSKNRKSMNYYLMMYVTENHLRTSVESIQDKQGIGGDPLKNLEEKDIAAWMDKFCGDKPDSSMQAAAEAYAKVLVEEMPASAKSEPRAGAQAAAPAGGAAAAAGGAAPAEKKSMWSFKIGRTCESWVNGRKGLDYYLMMNSSGDYLKGKVEELRQARGVTKDPLEGVSDKDIARQLDEHCPANLRQPLETALDAYADRLVGPGTVAQPAAGARPEAAVQAPVGRAAPPAAAATTAPAPRKAAGFAVNRTCDSWNSGRKGLDYYLMISKSEDYLKAEAAALAAERGVTKDPMQGIGSKEIAAFLDQYCPQRGKEPLEAALDVYAGQLVGGSPAPQPRTQTAAEAPRAAQAPAAAAAAPAAPATSAPPPRKPTGFAVGRTCDSWNSGRKGLDYYLMISKSEDYLKAEAAALAAERGVTKDPMQGIGSKEIAAWLDQYCPQRGKEQLEVALSAYANQLVGPGTAPRAAAESPATATTTVPAAAAPQAAAKAPAAPAASAAPQAPREPAYLGGGRNCAAWTAARGGQEYYNLIESSEAQLRSDVRVLRETRGLTYDPLESVSRKDIAAFLDGYCAERPKAPLESAVRVYANQLLSNK